MKKKIAVCVFVLGLLCMSWGVVKADDARDEGVPLVDDGRLYDGDIVLQFSRWPTDLTKFLQAHRLGLRAVLEPIDVVVVRPLTDFELERLALFAERLSELDEVGLAFLSFGEDNVLDYTPNDPEFGNQWGLLNANVPDAWDTVTGSASVVVAVLDTGIDYNHEDISSNMWTNAGEIDNDCLDNDGNQYVDDYYGFDFIWAHVDGGVYWETWDKWNQWTNHGVCLQTDGPMDDNEKDGQWVSHGTHVAGTIGAVMDNGVGIAGIAQIRLMAVKVLNHRGGITAFYQIPQGIQYATDNGADIISMSFGSTISEVIMWGAMCRYAEQNGVLLIASSGNDDMNWERSDSGSTKHYPSSWESVMGIGATNEDDQRATLEDWGPEHGSNYGAELDLVAPGTEIISTIRDGYASYSGTSMAAPHVSGIAALVKAVNPSLSSTAMRSVLLFSATDLNYRRGEEVAYEERDIFTGFGLIDAYEAVSSASGYTRTSYEFLVNEGDARTNSRLVTLTLHVPKSDQPVTGVMFSNNGVTWPNEWDGYQLTWDWTLSSGDSTKTVYCKYKLADDTEHTLSDTIDLDTSIPVPVTNLYSYLSPSTMSEEYEDYADGMEVSEGTIISGDISSTYDYGGDYLQIREELVSGFYSLEVDFEFVLSTAAESSGTTWVFHLVGHTSAGSDDQMDFNYWNPDLESWVYMFSVDESTCLIATPCEYTMADLDWKYSVQIQATDGYAGDTTSQDDLFIDGMHIITTLPAGSYADVVLRWDLSPNDPNHPTPTPPFDVARYKIIRADDIEGPYEVVGQERAGDTEWIDVGAAATDSDYFYMVLPEDNHNNRGMDQNMRAAKFFKLLEYDTNFVSTPLKPLDTDIEEVLRSLKGRLDRVSYYDASRSQDNWRIYYPWKPYNDLTDIDETMGFWVLLTYYPAKMVTVGQVPVSTPLPVYHVVSNWNMVGYPSFKDRTVEEAFEDSCYDSIEGFDPNSPPYYLRDLTPDDIISSGMGLWVEFCDWITQWDVSNHEVLFRSESDKPENLQVLKYREDVILDWDPVEWSFPAVYYNVYDSFDKFSLFPSAWDRETTFATAYVFLDISRDGNTYHFAVTGFAGFETSSSDMGTKLQFDFNPTILAPEGIVFGLDSTVYMGMGIDLEQEVCPSLVDMDNDGDIDLVVGHRKSGLMGPTPYLTYWRNDGTASTGRVWTLVPSFFDGVNSHLDWLPCPTFGDMDGDLDYDLTVGGMQGTFRYFRNDGIPFSPVWIYDPLMYSGIGVGSHSTPALGDLDSDGDLDLTSGACDGELKYYRRDGSSWVEDTLMYQGIDVGYESAPALTDIDLDGDLDLTVGSSSNGLFYYRNAGNPSSPIWEEVEYLYKDVPEYNWAKPAFGDIDDDGDSDLTVGNYYGDLYYHEFIAAKAFWISLPYLVSYATASDIVWDFLLQNPCTATDYPACGIAYVRKWRLGGWGGAGSGYGGVHYYARYEGWTGYDFTIAPGHGVEIGIGETRMLVVDGSDSRTTLEFDYPPWETDRVWFSLPYSNSYLYADQIVQDIEGSPPGSNHITAVGKQDRTTGLLTEYYFDPVGGWIGDNFRIETGDAIYFKILTDFVWSPDIVVLP